MAYTWNPADKHADVALVRTAEGNEIDNHTLLEAVGLTAADGGRLMPARPAGES